MINREGEYSDRVKKRKYPTGRFAFIPGWKNLVDNLVEALEHYEVNYEIMQIKEKYGGLRIYTTGVGSLEGMALITFVENLSESMCIECGKTCEMRNYKGWIYPACDEHVREKKEYWITYTDGTIKQFTAESESEARHYFMMEGDHAYDYGLVSPDDDPNL